MHFHGDELAANQVVTVNGRKVMADIKEGNTEEGWVEIFMPVLKDVNTIHHNGDVDEQSLPLFDSEVKRLEGKIEIVGLKT